MGVCPSRNNGIYACEKEREKNPEIFMEKARLLQQEISVVLNRREEECRAYEREVVAFSLREAEWKKERKKLREEVKRLRRCLKERQEEDGGVMVGLKRSEKEGQQVVLDGVTTRLLVEQMREERARRDEAVQKWKMLYHDIKNELDDLIQRTHQGGGVCWRTVEEDKVGKLQRELKAKEETIQSLKTQIASMEQEEHMRKGEVDILRQSLRILSIKKKAAASKCVAKTLSKIALIN
ncbi:hypothetical protein Ancab_030804 [Ancistrocladus abbreviatus]